MKKIIAIVLAVSSLFFLTVSKTLADWSAGVAGTVGVYEASGSEVLSGGKTSTAVEHAKFGFPQVFIEFKTEAGPSIGLEMIPGTVTTTTTSRTDYNTSDGDGDFVCTGNDFCGTSGTNSVKVEISHLKSVGKDNWGNSNQALDLIDKYSNDGLDIHVDQYPYTARSTMLKALLLKMLDF